MKTFKNFMTEAPTFQPAENPAAAGFADPAVIMKINALNPSIQRIILGADDFLKKENYTKANSELERAFRLTKSEGALYLRIAHLRYKQGLLKESESFASRGLLLGSISSWERLLLNVYLKN